MAVDRARAEAEGRLLEGGVGLALATGGAGGAAASSAAAGAGAAGAAGASVVVPRVRTILELFERGP
jgi:hypothetical protein